MHVVSSCPSRDPSSKMGLEEACDWTEIGRRDPPACGSCLNWGPLWGPFF